MNTVETSAESDQDERTLIGQRLLEARKYLGFTQGEVSEHLGVTRTALVEIEKG